LKSPKSFRGDHFTCVHGCNSKCLGIREVTVT
jgi:hypothetical protein